MFLWCTWVHMHEARSSGGDSLRGGLRCKCTWRDQAESYSTSKQAGCPAALVLQIRGPEHARSGRRSCAPLSHHRLRGKLRLPPSWSSSFLAIASKIDRLLSSPKGNQLQESPSAAELALQSTVVCFSLARTHRFRSQSPPGSGLDAL